MNQNQVEIETRINHFTKEIVSHNDKIKNLKKEVAAMKKLLVSLNASLEAEKEKQTIAG